MTPAARLSAAIEVVGDIEARRRPAADALKDWGLSHRFAGSSDRAAIAGLVYDALRRKSSSAWLMGATGPRAVLIGMLRRERGLGIDDIAALCSGARFAPAPLTEAERAALAGDTIAGAPAHVRGDYPDWLDPDFSKAFGDDRAAEGEALASRAPLDLRVNTLKAEREEIEPKLAHLELEPTRWSPIGLRLRLAADSKNPAIHAEPAFLKGAIEVQDEGSQLAALFAGAKAGQQIVDLSLDHRHFTEARARGQSLYTGVLPTRCEWRRSFLFLRAHYFDAAKLQRPGSLPRFHDATGPHLLYGAATLKDCPNVAGGDLYI
jgi:16S rRNA (cytosine967-C5)-methyltransferase